MPIPVSRVAILTALLLLAPGGARAAAGLRFDGEEALGFDNNPGSSRAGADKVPSGFTTLRAAADYTRLVAPTLAFGVRGQVAGETFWRVHGLSSVKATAMTRLRWRPDGTFYAPALTIWASVSWWEFDSAIRDSNEYRAGAFVDELLTTRLSVRLEANGFRRAADSPMFDLSGQSAGVALQWLATDRLTARAALDVGTGTTVASGVPTDRLEGTAQVDGPDDALRPGMRAYRLRATTHDGTADLNYRLNEHLGIDLELRSVSVDGKGGNTYARRIGTVSVLARF